MNYLGYKTKRRCRISPEEPALAENPRENRVQDPIIDI